MERELSAYRFVNGILTPITTPVEIQSIEEATTTAASKGFDGAHEHLNTALRLLGNKPYPDYRNSIKESISAIESVARKISGEKEFRKALARLSENADISPALKEGFIKLYGFTSGGDGIRHALLDQKGVGFAEAKYMLVACSCFVGYLISKAETANLIQSQQSTTS